MTKQQVISLAVERLGTPGFLEENDIYGFMSTILEVLGDEGIREDHFFGTTDENKASDILYLMAQEVRTLHFA